MDERALLARLDSASAALNAVTCDDQALERERQGTIARIEAERLALEDDGHDARQEAVQVVAQAEALVARLIGQGGFHDWGEDDASFGSEPTTDP